MITQKRSKNPQGFDVTKVTIEGDDKKAIFSYYKDENGMFEVMITNFDSSKDVTYQSFLRSNVESDLSEFIDNNIDKGIDQIISEAIWEN